MNGLCIFAQPGSRPPWAEARPGNGPAARFQGRTDEAPRRGPAFRRADGLATDAPIGQKPCPYPRIRSAHRAGTEARPARRAAPGPTGAKRPPVGQKPCPYPRIRSAPLAGTEARPARRAASGPHGWARTRRPVGGRVGAARSGDRAGTGPGLGLKIRASGYSASVAKPSARRLLPKQRPPRPMAGALHPPGRALPSLLLCGASPISLPDLNIMQVPFQGKNCGRDGISLSYFGNKTPQPVGAYGLYSKTIANTDRREKRPPRQAAARLDQYAEVLIIQRSL